MRGNHIQTENNLLHTFQKVPPVACRLSFTLAQPVFQALWLTALPLAQPYVWETFALHTLLSLCALNTVFMQACCAHSHLPSWSFFFFFLSTSFDKLTCKEGLFTPPRAGHIPPPGMQAWASLCVSQIVGTFKSLVICHVLRMPLGCKKSWSVLCCPGFYFCFGSF